VRFVLVVALALAWFGTLALRPLYKADESRYAEIPREMVASGDWITPRLNGFKYFEKPPLQYWATAAFFELFGDKDWAARLWAALTGFAGVLLVLAAGNRLFRPPAGYFAAAVLAGSPLYVVLGQVSTLDMGVTFFLTAAVLALCAGRMLLFWAACAATLGLLLSGIVMWFPESFGQGLRELSYVVHDVAFILFFAMIIGHIYLGTAAEPGTFSAMTRGTVTKEWARLHHPKWYREVTGGRASR